MVGYRWKASSLFESCFGSWSVKDTSYTNFVSAIEAKNDSSLTNLKTFSTPRLLAPSPKLNKKVDNENVLSSLQNMEDKICQNRWKASSLFESCFGSWSVPLTI
jgi:hypothetical protein